MATNPIWSEISTYMGNKISNSAIHTLVHKYRYGIKEKLGFLTREKPIISCLWSVQLMQVVRKI